MYVVPRYIHTLRWGPGGGPLWPHNKLWKENWIFEPFWTAKAKPAHSTGQPYITIHTIITCMYCIVHTYIRFSLAFEFLGLSPSWGGGFWKLALLLGWIERITQEFAERLKKKQMAAPLFFLSFLFFFSACVCEKKKKEKKKKGPSPSPPQKNNNNNICWIYVRN